MSALPPFPKWEPYIKPEAREPKPKPFVDKCLEGMWLALFAMLFILGVVLFFKTLVHLVLS